MRIRQPAIGEPLIFRYEIPEAIREFPSQSFEKPEAEMRKNLSGETE